MTTKSVKIGLSFPTFEQLDELDSVVHLSRKMAQGHRIKDYRESELAMWAIAYALTLFFVKLHRDS